MPSASLSSGRTSASPAKSSPTSAAARRRSGRDPRDILIFYNRAAVVGRTRQARPRKSTGSTRTRQHRGGAGAFLELYRHRLLPLRTGRADPVREERRDQLGGRDADHAERRALDIARIVEPDGAGQPQPAIVGSAEEVADELIILGRGNRYRRLQPQPHRDPREASRTSSIWSCRSCRSAASTSAITCPARCARSCLAKGSRSCLTRIPALRIASSARSAMRPSSVTMAA